MNLEENRSPRTTGSVKLQADLRQTILDESRHLLVAHGYDSLSMRKIAARIGYSATTIYLHFESKESLFHALIEEGLERMFQFLTGIASSEKNPLKRLRQLCQGYVEFGLANPEYYEVMFVMKPALNHRFPQDKYRRARRTLDLFGDALGTVRLVDTANDVDVASTQIWATLHGVVSLIIARRIDARLDESELIDKTIAGILATVKAREPLLDREQT